MKDEKRTNTDSAKGKRREQEAAGHRGIWVRPKRVNVRTRQATAGKTVPVPTEFPFYLGPDS